MPLYLICKPTRKQNSIGELGLQNCMVIVVTPTQSISCFWIGNCLGNGARDMYCYHNCLWIKMFLPTIWCDVKCRHSSVECTMVFSVWFEAAENLKRTCCIDCGFTGRDWSICLSVSLGWDVNKMSDSIQDARSGEFSCMSASSNC